MSHSARMATYVLVHGAGHGGWCYGRLAPLLRAAGHEVFTPTLTGLGERAHLLTADTSLTTHIEDVAQLLEHEDLREVILVGHSYGGMVITGAADRALPRIGQLVYLDATIPRDGEALVDSSPGARIALAAEARVVDGVELVLWPDSPIARHIYGVEDEADWAWMLPRLRPHPWRAFTEPLVLHQPAEIASLPRTIINCTPTLAVRAGHETIERYQQADRVWEIDTGHDLMITEPEATARLLLRLVPGRDL
jgi:pimeloyl-ACP methyl ester carboxylesterase